MTVVWRQPIALLSIGQDLVYECSRGAGKHADRIHQLSEALAKLGWQVDIFTYQTHPDQPTVEWTAPHCRIVRLALSSTKSLRAEQVPEFVFHFIKAFQAFQTKAGTNYPLIHTQDWLSGCVGLKLKERNNVQWVHTCWLTEPLSVDSAGQAGDLLMPEHDIARQADQVVLMSSAGAGSSGRPIQVSEKAQARAKLGLDPNEQVMLYVGQLHPSQGIDTLIEALALYQESNSATGIQSRPLRCLVVGQSSATQQQWQQVEQLIDKFALTHQVTLVASVPPEQHWLYYAAADACAIPSRSEPFGASALAALDWGLPIVAADVGGLRFTIAQGETGLLVPSGDASALAIAIGRILSDQWRSKRLGRGTEAQLDPSSAWNRVAAHLSDLYRHRLAHAISTSEFDSTQVQPTYTLPLPQTATAQPAIGTDVNSPKELVPIP